MGRYEYAVVIRTELDTGGSRKGARELDGLLDQLDKNALTRTRRLSAERLRALQRSNREQGREHDRAARDAAAVYEKHLGQGLFSRLGRAASDAFKRTFSASGLMGGGGGGGGGSILGGAASVLGGNILTSVLGGAMGAITGAIQTGFDYNKVKEQTLLGFEIKLKGREQAEDFFRQIEAFAARAPQELGQVLESTQRLMSAFKPDQALQALGAITDAVAFQGKVGGEAQESINGIGTALSQVLYKNKLSAEEMMQLAERQINGYKYLAAEIAKTDQAFAALTDEEQQGRVMEMAQKGLLNAKTAVAVIIRGMQAEFGGTAARIAKETAAGMESNITDSLNRTAGIASESAFQRYKQFLDKANTLLQTGAAERIAGGISATTGALFEGMEATLRAITPGNLAQLGLDAAASAAEGVKAGGKGLYEAGVGAAGRLEKGWRDGAVQHSPSQLFLGLGFEAGQSLLFGFQQGVSKTGRATREEIDRFIKEAAERFKVPEALIHAVVKKESSYKQFAESNMGAQGLMQLMPGTAKHLGVTNSFDVQQNVMGGTKYLAQLLAEFRDVRLALAAYNAGPGAVRAFLPNRPDVNSYVGGSGRRWTVSEEAAQRAQGIPQNKQTRDYVSTIMRDYARFQTGGGAVSAPVPVVIQNIQPLQDFFAQFVGKGYTPPLALGHTPPDRPASGDLRGGTGMFAGDSNPRGFAEWLYSAQKSMAGSDRTTVAEQADWRHTVELMAEEMKVSRAVMREIQNRVAQRLEDERQQLAALQAQGAGGGGAASVAGTNAGNFLNITPEQARRAVEIATRGAGELKHETAELAQTVVPQALASVQLVAKETGDAFADLPPLVKQAGGEMQKEMDQVARTISGMLGGVLQGALRGQWRDGLRGLRDDFLSWTVSLFETWAQSRILKALSPSGGAGGAGGGGVASVAGAGGGNMLGSLWGGVKKLFGGGGSSTSGMTGGFAGGGGAADYLRGGITAPAAMTLPHSSIPKGAIEQWALGGGGAAAGAGSFGFGATKFNALLPMLGAQLGGGLVSAIAGPQAGGLAGMLGMAGGGLLGVGLTGAPAALSGSFLAPLFSNPVTAIIGGALLVGGILYGRNKQRQADERTRNTISNDTGTAIWDLIGRARDLTPSQANQEWAQIENNYRQQLSQIKDGKTKRNATLQWTNDFFPLKRIVDQRVAEGEKARAFSDAFVPTFAQGGGVAFADGGVLSSFARGAYASNPLGYVRGPGTPKSDSIAAWFPVAQRHARISDTEYVLDAETTRNVGVERLDRLRASKGKGLAEGGSVSPVVASRSTASASGSTSTSSEVAVTVLLGKEDVTRAFISIARSQEFRDAVVGAAWDDLDRRGDLLSKILLETVYRRK